MNLYLKLRWKKKLVSAIRKNVKKVLKKLANI